MEGIVSILDAAHQAQVEGLWAEVEAILGRAGAYAAPVPHFSFQVAADYDLPALEPVLRRVAAGLRPFCVRTSGLGLFPGPRRVVYVPVVRSPSLSRLHEALWRALGGCGRDRLPLYAPSNWLPHITLAQGDFDPDQLAALVRQLGDRDLAWEIPIDNLAVLSAAASRPAVRLRVDLAAPAGRGERPAARR